MSDAIKADMTGNPGPLGLLGFGMTTILLNLHNAGIFPMNSVILAMGIFYGGLAQFVAGIMEWKKGSTFAAIAFMSYGAFWISLVALLLLPKTGAIAGPDTASLVGFLSLWGVFSVFMFIGTFRLSIALQIVFGLLVLLFAMLIIGDALGMPEVTKLAGYEGIVCGASAFYTGVAQVLNEVYGRTLLPLGPVAK